MPQIILMQPGQPVADFGVIGTKITVAGAMVDAADHQSDSGQIVEIRHNGATAQVGGDGAYLAIIEIPPAQYSDAVYGGEGEPDTPAQRLPLDPNTLVITLWPTA
ncbi:hypothetical protein [Pseudomonas vancouverensis]|uniref:Uncharacterized protein n=1 Tax=Pseudomonas vancouverensis TaxID=95300 RepID=A0A1H2N8X0_PSEVA|nr:hypothetical protein [Pseudomonas vancouverensis]KAB0494020.1 hypothetical protein F7R09_19785 [Pseudomonas vancouverensis]TDB61457.1 hypothetical protein EIY72_15435 [Pseudomonas vancouverensis]SDV01738.1 hypothetical protein SAMN05216558_1868 [Pseudomonas vancouverensis]